MEVKFHETEKYKCPALKAESEGVTAVAVYNLRNSLESKKCTGERNGPYVDVEKPPAKIYPLRQLGFKELLQRCVHRRCSGCFLKCFHEKEETGGRLGLPMTGKMFSLTNPQSGKYDLPPIQDLNLSKVYYSWKMRIIPLIGDKIALRHFLDFCPSRGGCICCIWDRRVGY